MTGKYTLPKKERLCSKKLIEQLFLDRSGVKKEWPVKVVYQLVDREKESEPQLLFMVSVSKRHFKRAVKRNLVKRQVREAYRVNKEVFTEVMALFPNKKLMVAFIWMQDKIYTTEDVKEAVAKVMSRIVKAIELLANKEDDVETSNQSVS